MKIAVICGFTIILTAACHDGLREVDCFSAPTTAGVDRAAVGCCNVCVPAGEFLLLRRGHFIAALRFSSLHQVATDALLGCADYELHERSDGILTFRDGRDKRTVGRVSRLESHGIHPLVVQEGAWNIVVDGTHVNYSPLSCVTFPPDAEVAPTHWSEVSRIDGADTSLQWFKVDPTGTRETIVIDEK
jgi:hypothetical protein